MTSQVFFHALSKESSVKASITNGVKKVLQATRITDRITSDDVIACKVHFGEKGNTTFVKPELIQPGISLLKKTGAKLFITDSNTLYVGDRSNACDHLTLANEHGFGYHDLGLPVIIADGLLGKDYFSKKIDLEHLSSVKISSAAYLADGFIVFSHFKGHMMAGFGGALKNVGMGFAPRSGKQILHSDIKPVIDREHCQGCMLCSQWCPENAITKEQGTAIIDSEKCIGCGECVVTCPHDCISINWKTEIQPFQEKTIEYVYGILKGKESKTTFVNYVINVTPNCDCMAGSEIPIVPDIGVLASDDPVALDQACVDLVNAQVGNPDSYLKSGFLPGEDKFLAIWPEVNYNFQLDHAEKIGLGSRKYKLIEI